MFENACLFTVRHEEENGITFIHISRLNDWGGKCYLLSNQLRDTISDQYSTCFQDGYNFLNIGKKQENAEDRPCSITRMNRIFYFQLPENAVDFLRHGSGSRSFLCYDRVTYPKMDFSQAQDTLKKIIENPKTRRALCKAMETSFRWPDICENHKIRFYPDGGVNFFWREFYDDKPAMCGGLIYSEYNGHSRYSVHT